MLFMVIEQFRNSDPKPIGVRFREQGRMMPDGVNYVASWIDAPRARCFQVMETDNREKLDQWINCWSDLVDFEVIPVMTSAEYWTLQQAD